MLGATERRLFSGEAGLSRRTAALSQQVVAGRSQGQALGLERYALARPRPAAVAALAVGIPSATGHSSSSRSVPPGSRMQRPITPSGRTPQEGYTAPPGRRNGELSAQVMSYDTGLGRELLQRKADVSELGTRTSAASNRSHSVVHSGGAVSSNANAAACEKAANICDKCDGRHTTDRCPHFHKEREKHKDAWVNYGRQAGPHQMGSSGGNFILRSARVMRQPGDGSCLFHSLVHGLSSGCAQTLRRDIASFLQQNSSLQIAGDTLEEWVRWDANTTVPDYARRMAVSGWGGGIEMACCSLMKNVNVHVYENVGRGFSNEFKRISCFDAPNAAKTIHVLYQGGVHYDALQPT